MKKEASREPGEKMMVKEEWKIDPKEVEIVEKIGEGTGAKVYKGKYHDKTVAVKVLKPFNDEKQKLSIEKEIKIMGTLRSPYVIYFHGCIMEPKICIIMEFCQKGSLYHVLQDKTWVFDWPNLFKTALEIVTGLEFLHHHDPIILHRDLKTLNLLVDDDFHIKLCDFGLSRTNTNSSRSTLGKMRGTFAYTAPEVYWGQSYTTKSDVYSLSVILWELMMRCILGYYSRPYSEFKNLTAGFQVILKTAKQGLRPTIPPKHPKLFTELLQMSWDPDPNKRPDTKAILAIINGFVADFKVNPDNWPYDPQPDPNEEKK
eukprot:TRINITY_DN1555_c0_g1_i3.p1 TRINITY_DN1555_c0_g1~~TRINITY_DN1555_c0_g1_i3.p1  ORF type:complete len:315 (-),score=39.48 TRINITY_DN1555_c0_g1_i3:460-1404(-)